MSEIPPQPVLMIGSVPVYGDLVLAPMDGYTDMPFRGICRQLGAALIYTEFINGIEVVHNHPHLAERAAFSPLERPLVYQLFDDNPERLIRAGEILLERKPDIIDVNLGCSARTVTNRGAGAALLKSPEKIAAILSGLVKTLPIPVTAKIRLGWNSSTRNYLQIAQLVEDCGCQALAVHGRTKEQGYTGQADWDAIAEIRQRLHIPVIGNGDVKTAEDIFRMQQHTGCTAVMIGRASISNPWIFSKRNRNQVPPNEVFTLLFQQIEAMTSFYGDERGLTITRKFIKKYLEPYLIEREIILHLMTSTSKDKVLDQLHELQLQIV